MLNCLPFDIYKDFLMLCHRVVSKYSKILINLQVKISLWPMPGKLLQG